MSRLTVHYNNSGDKTGFDDFLKVAQPEFVYSLNGNIRNSVNKFSPKTKSSIVGNQSAGNDYLMDSLMTIRFRMRLDG